MDSMDGEQNKTINQVDMSDISTFFVFQEVPSGGNIGVSSPVEKIT